MQANIDKVYILCEDWTDIDGSCGTDIVDIFVNRDAADQLKEQLEKRHAGKIARFPGGSTARYEIVERALNQAEGV